MNATWLLDESGLTVSQVGRAVGVSARTVHHWTAGAEPSGSAAERLLALRQLVEGLDAQTPAGRRAALLDSSAGASLFSLFLAGTPRAQQVHFPVPVAERLGAPPS